MSSPGPNGSPTPQILPQPTPVQFAVQPLQSNTGPLLALTAFTPVGQFIYFLDPDTAQSLAAILTQNASQARSGLILPGNIPLKGPTP